MNSWFVAKWRGSSKRSMAMKELNRNEVLSVSAGELISINPFMLGAIIGATGQAAMFQKPPYFGIFLGLVIITEIVYETYYLPSLQHESNSQ
jgi:hypothetical protein